MRANQSAIACRGDAAEVGIGTMIVFIATVLVAAAAAAVLLDVSGKLQEKSSRTGQEATEQVASNFEVESIYGQRDAPGDAGLDDLYLYVALAPGAETLDMSQLRVQLQNATQFKTFDHVNGAADADSFNVTSIRDTDSGFTSAKPIMTAGDLVRIHIDLDTAFGAVEGYEPRQNVRVILLPEVGSKVETSFVTPNTYGTNTYIRLH